MSSLDSGRRFFVRASAAKAGTRVTLDGIVCEVEMAEDPTLVEIIPVGVSTKHKRRPKDGMATLVGDLPTVDPTTGLPQGVVGPF